MSGKRAVFLAVATILALLSVGYAKHQIDVVRTLDQPAAIKVGATDARAPAQAQPATVATPAPPALPGTLSWTTIAPGFEVGELAVIADGAQADLIYLARIDARRYRFELRNAPEGERDLAGWISHTGAAMVINGSFFKPDGMPQTPILSGGAWRGPGDYQASHGAFVASDQFTGVVDLAGGDWRGALGAAHDGMVSYPLLLAADGSSRVHANPDWLARRSFVGHDNRDRIILGTTRDASFSLERLAQFLKAAPLDLRMALNLDGGPFACQAIALRGFQRSQCGNGEVDGARDEARFLRPTATRRVALPIVLVVLAKDSKPARARHRARQDGRAP